MIYEELSGLRRSFRCDGLCYDVPRVSVPVASSVFSCTVDETEFSVVVKLSCRSFSVSGTTLTLSIEIVLGTRSSCIVIV